MIHDLSTSPGIRVLQKQTLAFCQQVRLILFVQLFATQITLISESQTRFVRYPYYWQRHLFSTSEALHHRLFCRS